MLPYFTLSALEYDGLIVYNRDINTDFKKYYHKETDFKSRRYRFLSMSLLHRKVPESLSTEI